MPTFLRCPPGASAAFGGAAAFVLAAVGAVAAARAESLPPPDEQKHPAIVVSEFIYAEAPFPSCHASTLVEGQGQLVAAWFGGTHERHPDVGIWVAHRTDDGWSAPVEAADGVESPAKRYPTWNPVLFQPKTGPLMLFYKVGPSPSEWWGMVKTSTDAGRTWSAARRLPDGVIGPVKNKPIQLPNGDILSGSSTEHDGWRVHFERSTDNGATWTVSPAVNDGRTIGAIQPSLLRHGDGRLQAVGRTKRSGVFAVWSDDAGQSWSAMGATVLPNPNAGTDAVTLADGRHVLVYNHDDAERSPLNVAISRDGKAWDAALVLEDEPTHQYSYPAVIQTADGLVHVTYTWRRERIRHVAFDPARLAPEPIVDGVWPAALRRAPREN